MGLRGPKAKSVLERFERHVSPEPNTGCFLWDSGFNEQGRGCFGVLEDGKWVTKKAHRIAWQLYKGPIPEGLGVLHLCNNGHLGCVNVDHLYLGTQRDNHRDSVKAGTNVDPTFKRKFKPEIVRELQRRFDSGEFTTTRALAAELGLRENTVFLITRRYGGRYTHPEDFPS